MKTKHQKYLTIIPVIVLFLFTTCRKNITVPISELDNLFGTWTMYQYSGGEGGGIFNPDGRQTIEFNKKGICKSYKNDKQQAKKKFTFSENSTQYGSMTIYTIKYEKTGISLFNRFPEVETQQTIIFFGQDTLILTDPCCDQYQYNYVKK